MGTWLLVEVVAQAAEALLEAATRQLAGRRVGLEQLDACPAVREGGVERPLPSVDRHDDGGVVEGGVEQ